jgi:hypothetical protein
VVDASIQECVAYPDVMEAAISNLGDKPRAVVADRGFSTKGVFEWNTRRGIASVIPFRETPQRTGRQDHDAYDRPWGPALQALRGNDAVRPFCGIALTSRLVSVRRWHDHGLQPGPVPGLLARLEGTAADREGDRDLPRFAELPLEL